MADDNEKLIEQFCVISGVDRERSRFYLESAAWNIETALESLFEGDETSNPPEESESDRKSATRGPDMPRVSMVDSDSSDEEEGQAFYAGGSEHSGQQVLGPPKKKKDMVSMLFKSAKEHGAEVLESRNKGVGKKLNFAGTGYRLGETESDHEVVSGPSKPDEKPKDVTLRMWKNGFTVDGGTLRQYEDPSNHEFLDSVRRGQVPIELVRSARGGEVYINMEDHRHEEYVPEKTKAVAFSGAGHTLGSLAPTVIGQVTDTGTPGGSCGRAGGASSVTVTNPENTSFEEEAKRQLNLDASKPVTSIQIRLPDGSRMILRLNHDHTVGDIRQYVVTARPQLTTFAIMTTFPHAELKDDSKTVIEANLLNSAIVLK